MAANESISISGSAYTGASVGPSSKLFPVIGRRTEQLRDHPGGQWSGDPLGELEGGAGRRRRPRIPYTISRTFGSRIATCRRVNPVLISLRSCRCRGGSVKIRLPSCTGFGITGSGIVMPLVEENRAGLLETYRMSSYLSSAQNFGDVVPARRARWPAVPCKRGTGRR